MSNNDYLLPRRALLDMLAALGIKSAHPIYAMSRYNDILDSMIKSLQNSGVMQAPPGSTTRALLEAVATGIVAK